MLRKKALAAATAGVLVLATGAISVAALSGVRILGFNASSTASAVPAVTGGPASVLIVNKKHVITKKGAAGQPDTTILVEDTVPAAPATVADPGSGVPLVVRAADAPGAPDDTTSPPAVSQPSSDAASATPASPAAGSSGVSPASPSPVPTVATTSPKPTTVTTPKPATVTTSTTAAPAATITTTTAAPIVTTTTTTAAPAVTTTTTIAKPAKTTSSGQVIPTSWQLSSSFLKSGKPIPPYPVSCRNGQLEDNGVWNCG